jgi:hypothetical protein
MDSASNVESLDLHDVLMSDWVVEELSESKVNEKDLVWPIIGTYYKIVWFNIEMNIMVIIQWLEN